MDMHSGGGRKLSHKYIIINLPEDEAIKFFEEKLGRNPNNVTCDCCGEDYSIHEFDSKKKALECYQVEDSDLLYLPKDLVGDTGR